MWLKKLLIWKVDALLKNIIFPSAFHSHKTNKSKFCYPEFKKSSEHIELNITKSTYHNFTTSCIYWLESKNLNSTIFSYNPPKLLPFLLSMVRVKKNFHKEHLKNQFIQKVYKQIAAAFIRFLSWRLPEFIYKQFDAWKRKENSR